MLKYPYNIYHACGHILQQQVALSEQTKIFPYCNEYLPSLLKFQKWGWRLLHYLLRINFNKYLGCDAGETWCFCIWLQGMLTSPLPLPLLPESLLLVSGLVIVTGCFFTMVKYLFQSLSLLSHMTCRLRGPVFLRLPSNFRLPKWQGTIWESVNLSQLVYWSIVNWDF
jgi:hypothetical protein